MALGSATSPCEHFGILECSQTETSAFLNPQKQYTVVHLGVDASGTDDSNSDETVFLSTTSETTPSFAELNDIFPLQDAVSVVVGPGISRLYATCAAGTGDPTLAFSAGARQFGDF